MRLLRVNALHLWTLWLAGDKTLSVPIAPAPRFVRAGHAYTVDEFFDAAAGAGQPFGAGTRR